MLEDKIARTKKLIDDRTAIDEELAELLGITQKPKRGRPAKEKGETEMAPPSLPLETT